MALRHIPEREEPANEIIMELSGRLSSVKLSWFS